MKSKILSFYSDISIVVFVLSFVATITLILIAIFGYLDEQSSVIVEVQSTYVVNTKNDKLNQSGFNLGEPIEKDSFNTYYLKGKQIGESVFFGLELNEVIDLPISKEVYDNINSLGVSKVIYDNSNDVKIYNENYVSYTDKLVKNYTFPVFLVLVLSIANLYFVPDTDNNYIRLKG